MDHDAIIRGIAQLLTEAAGRIGETELHASLRDEGRTLRLTVVAKGNYLTTAVDLAALDGPVPGLGADAWQHMIRRFERGRGDGD